MFRASMCPSSGEKLLYLCDIGICHSVWLASDLLVGVEIQPADQTPPIQSDQCRIYTAIFLLMMGTWMPETCREEKYINILKRIVHLVGFTRY